MYWIVNQGGILNIISSNVFWTQCTQWRFENIFLNLNENNKYKYTLFSFRRCMCMYNILFFWVLIQQLYKWINKSFFWEKKKEINQTSFVPGTKGSYKNVYIGHRRWYHRKWQGGSSKNWFLHWNKHKLAKTGRINFFRTLKINPKLNSNECESLGSELTGSKSWCRVVGGLV